MPQSLRYKSLPGKSYRLLKWPFDYYESAASAYLELGSNG